MLGSKADPPVPDKQRFPQGTALLQNVLESGAVATLLCGPDGIITYINTALTEMLGYERQETLGMELNRLIHPESLGEALASLNRLFAGETDKCRAERLLIRKDGEAIWALVSASVLRNERTGQPISLIAQLTDIDRQKRAESALAAVESRWNLALEGAGQGVWDHNIGTKVVFYSRMWRIMRGFAPDQIVDGSMDLWLARVHPDDRDRIREIVIRQDAGEIPYNAFEYRERHRDGHYIWILSRGRPVEWFPDGTPARIVGTDTDISGLKRVGQELEEEKERLNVTLQSIGDGVISTDPTGRVSFMNPVAERMTGWVSSEAVGQRVEDVFEIVDEATGNAARNPVVECLVRKEPCYLEDSVVLVSRSGERRDIRDSASPVRTADGRIIGAVLVFQDVTQSRAVQKQLAHSAMHDSLTGLPNRPAFEAALRAARQQVESEQRVLALCFIDLDRFKRVNDSAGHAAGDALLKVIGGVIRSECRANDFTARIGGDEFALLLADCSVESAQRIAQQIVDGIAGVSFAWGGKVYEIGASVGITPITSGAPASADLLAQADTACYAAKDSGRNCVAIYDGRTPSVPRFRQAG